MIYNLKGSFKNVSFSCTIIHCNVIIFIIIKLMDWLKKIKAWISHDGTWLFHEIKNFVNCAWKTIYRNYHFLTEVTFKDLLKIYYFDHWFEWSKCSEKSNNFFRFVGSVWPWTLCSKIAWKVSVFGVILVRIFPYSDWMRRDTLYSVQMRGNAYQNNSEYGHFLRSVRFLRFLESLNHSLIQFGLGSRKDVAPYSNTSLQKNKRNLITIKTVIDVSYQSKR